GLTSVKALVHRNLDEEEAHRMAFTKNVVRKNLSPLDRANAISLARRRGLKRVAITSAFGMSEKQLQRYEKLLEVPEALQRLVDDGRASMAHAFVLSRHKGLDLYEWVARALENKWSAIVLQREIRKVVKSSANSRRREFIRSSENEVRGYAWRVSRNSSPEELDRAIEAHEESLRVLRGFRRISKNDGSGSEQQQRRRSSSTS